MKRSKVHVGLTSTYLIAGFALLLVFQNCSFPKFSTFSAQTNSSSGGGGIEGKLYYSYGRCENGNTELYKSIVVSSDASKAAVLRDDCQNLNAPRSVDPASLKFLLTNASTFVSDQRVFDGQTGSGDQRVTLIVCQDSVANPGVQVSLWQNANDKTALFGKVSLAGGVSSGDLSVGMPSSSTPNIFVSANGQTSQMNLTMTSDTTASLSYKIGASAQVASSPVACVKQNQSPPPPSGFADGSGAAPQGAPQAASLLDAYAFRPNWLIAGVHYPVGISIGTVLKDPTLISIPGVDIDVPNRVIVVKTSNITFDGYDFSLNGGYAVEVSSGTNTIVRNSIIGAVQTDAGAGSLTVENCVMDGGGVGSGNYGLIYHLGSGSITARYNWMKNFPAKGFHIGNGSASIDIQFNLAQNGNMEGGSQSAFYVSGGSYSSIVIAYNTVDQPVQLSPSSCEIAINDPSVSFANADIGFNTIIARGSSSNASTQVVMVVGPGAVSPGTDRALIHDNYIDATGTTMGPFWPGIATPLIVYSNNISLTSGAPLPTNP